MTDDERRLAQMLAFQPTPVLNFYRELGPLLYTKTAMLQGTARCVALKLPFGVVLSFSLMTLK